MIARQHLSTTKRQAIFDANGGCCHICTLPIRPGQAWDVSHDRALALLGEDDDANRKPAHRACHKERTKADMASLTKAKRVRAKHTGAYQPSRPFPGSKRDKFRKPFNGPAVLR